MTSENFDVWLFAVDLVNYVFLKCSKLRQDEAENNYLSLVCKSFTDIFKIAVQMITESVRQEVSEEFSKFQQQYKLRPDTYIKHCKELRKERFSQEFDAESFLNYSVYMASLAHCFYSGGDGRAQVSAVFVISDDYHHSNTKFSMWETLHRVAEKIVCGTTSTDNVTQKRPQLLQPLASDLDSFSSPEVETTTGKSNAYNEKTGRDNLTKTVRYNLLDCTNLTRLKFDEVSCSTSRRVVTRRTKEHARKISLKPMPSLEESLESSLEELSISKISRVELLKEDGSLNSTEEFEFLWKLGKLNKNSPKRSSIDNEIFRLSPIRNVRHFSPKSNTSFS